MCGFVVENTRYFKICDVARTQKLLFSNQNRILFIRGIAITSALGEILLFCLCPKTSTLSCKEDSLCFSVCVKNILMENPRQHQ